ncbi:hypothetical protein [Methanimicrococcus blatticola]|uniref:Uncharacterized protein n=1 Tax=Methanimicrococcus blatticola TaxID=91560 RepID=A0A484F679_9EURY|nr:hypothetical protein [Methanimicrococcus blatticola]MBZ3935220.1 hypothetical protein [Methanimicrococcus blatticola]MCC2508683.1 hypothetical protein [Methanimicrococcus blatticola]TDQ71280.1 hypothetical protein C7391_0387 [Methanimicrococcus blatticola]
MTSVYKTKDIESALLKKGFRETRKGAHKRYTYHFKENKTEFVTYTSHGVTEYSGSILSLMKNQLSLDRKQFDDLVSCPLTKEKLAEVYKDKGIIPNFSKKEDTEKISASKLFRNN